MEVRHDIARGLGEGTCFPEQEIGEAWIAAQSLESETSVGWVNSVFGFAHPLGGEAESQGVAPLDPGNVVVDVLIDVAFEVGRDRNGDASESRIRDRDPRNALVRIAERKRIGERTSEASVVN